MTNAVLKARGIVQFGHGANPPEILHGVNLDLAPGITALIGPNGSGKTTLMRTLAGLLPPFEGHVEVGDVALQDDPKEIRRRVGYLPQFPGVYRRLTVEEHFARQAIWLEHDAESARIEDTIVRFGLDEYRSTPAGELDAPLRRWLALALIWARKTRVAILDEPTADLDYEDRVHFWAHMLSSFRAADGPQALLVTTHLLDEVADYCAYAVMMVAGRVAYQGPVQGLQDQARGRAFWVTAGLPPGALESGVDVISGKRLGVLVAGAMPPRFLARDPELVDGYLVVEQQWAEDRWVHGFQTT